MKTYGIKGMTCEGCVGAVTKALQAVLGDVEFEVSLAENCVKVKGEHDPERVREAVEGAGVEFGG